MMIINAPQMQLEEVQCYKCNAIFKVYPLQNINSPFITDCKLHNNKLQNYDIQMNQNEIDINRCQHEYKKTLAKSGMYFIDMCHKCHDQQASNDCQHESDSYSYITNHKNPREVSRKCKKCGEFYR